MTILNMIAKWRRGCSFSQPNRPESCVPCTLRLINNIETALKSEQYSGCITPKLHEVIDELQAKPPKREDVDALLHEFFRLDKILKIYRQERDATISTVHMDFTKVEISKDFFETYFHQELANGKKV